jgi:hypothetical protein
MFARTPGGVALFAALGRHWLGVRHLPSCERLSRHFPRQQPGGGDTPGVAMAPVAFAGAIIPGVARFIVVLSAHADVFGVGITVVVGSMLVPPSCATTGCIVPGGGAAGICGVESGKAAPLLGGPPGVELHVVAEELPIGLIGAMLPVVVTRIGGIVPNGETEVIAAAGAIVDDVVIVVVPSIDVLLGTDDDIGTGTGVKEGCGTDGKAGGGGAGMVEPAKTVAADVSGCWENVSGATALPVVGEVLGGSAEIVGAADTDGIVAAVPAIADMEATGTGDVPGAIWPVGEAQVTTVPGVAASEAGGTGASVVSGAPGSVVAENGLGPLSGEVRIVPGVDESPIAVVPMVETCARLASHPPSRATATSSKRRIRFSAQI